MALRARLAFTVVTTLLVLAAAAVLVFRTIFLEAFLDVEGGQACRLAEGMTSLASSRLTALSSTAFDYAVRDDTWDFLSVRNPSYVRANINDQMFRELDIDGVLFLDSTGSEVHSAGYELTTSSRMPFPPQLSEQIGLTLVPVLLSGDGTESGFIAAGRSVWMVASCPVLKSGGVGPRVGTLVMTRLVDASILESLEYSPGMSVSLVAGSPPPGLPGVAECRSGVLSLSRVGADTLNAFLEVADLAGNPLVFRFSMPRDLFAAARRNTRLAVLMLVATGVLFAAVTAGMFEAKVMRRLESLMDRVRGLGGPGDRSGRILLGGSDEFAALSGTMDDALDRLEKAGDDARASRRRFDLFMKYMPGYAFITDRSGALVYASEKLRLEMLGGRTDWEGLHHRDVWPPVIAWEMEVGDEAMLKKPVPLYGEMTFTGLDGARRTITSFRFPLGGGDHAEMLTGGICFDITERVEAGRELARAEKRSTALYEAVPDTIFILDRAGVVRGFHGGVGGRLSVPPEAVVGTSIEAVGMAEEGLAAARVCLDRALREGSVEAFEYEITDGPSKGWFECRMAPLDADSVICTVRDVTSRKLMEADLLRSQKEESLSLMAGGIAHDFNNILSAIGGSLELAAEEPLPGASGPAVRNALMAVGKAAMLTRQLLTLAKGGEAGIVSRLDLGRVLRETVRIVLSGSAVEWRLEIDRDLPQVEMDEGQMVQVVSNLVVNARDAMQGRGSLVISAWPDSQGGRHVVRVTFDDSGPGIPPEIAAKLFDPYFTTKPTGSGLGLAVSRSIMQKYGGSLEVRRTQGPGASFLVTVPASGDPPRRD